jgi:hypothetical protein
LSYEASFGFFAVHSKCRCRGVRAQCLGTHQIEDFDIAERLPGQALERFPRFLPRLDAIAFQNEE